VAISDGQVRGFEALVRWRHPVKGLVAPDQFIGIAEETGQIVELGAWVLETACRQAQQWREQGLINVKMAVNVAARQFREASIVEQVFSVLDRTGLDPKQLELEMTEGVLMADPRTGERVARMRERGISIALDDFGTGFSSLSYITRFPIDTIKIDRCFVRDITADSEKGAIVAAVVSLSHSLGFNVVAEGVEFESELAVIGDLGCDEVQGYYYSKPQPASGIELWLQSRQLRCDTA
jgi:EAL domain-containing protein (putative c-di-GMP-specific phosphodiesterase class I)